jgi:hypothetical protein
MKKTAQREAPQIVLSAKFCYQIKVHDMGEPVNHILSCNTAATAVHSGKNMKQI